MNALRWFSTGARLSRKIRRAKDEYDDAVHREMTWGFGMRPSEHRRAKERVAAARERLEALIEKRNARFVASEASCGARWEVGRAYPCSLPKGHAGPHAHPMDPVAT